MSANLEKQACPPAVSFKSFIAFLNQLRDEHRIVPHRVDKTLMPKASGSQQAATLAALRYLALIDESGKPNERFGKLVASSDSERKPIFAELLYEGYPFIFEDKEFDLESASSGQMIDKFKELNLNGSTISKTMQFFLSAAKEAGIKVSTLIKAPSPPKPSNGGRKGGMKAKADPLPADDDSSDDDEESETERFEIPIPGKSSVKVIVPNDLDADDWEMLSSMITVYIKRWKGFTDKGQS